MIASCHGIPGNWTQGLQFFTTEPFLQPILTDYQSYLPVCLTKLPVSLVFCEKQTLWRVYRRPGKSLIITKCHFILVKNSSGMSNCCFPRWSVCLVVDIFTLHLLRLSPRLSLVCLVLVCLQHLFPGNVS